MTSGELRDTNCLEFLVANQNSDGGWGYHPASSSAVEATAWALAALWSWRRTPLPADACARAGEWLLKEQLADGSWPPYPGNPSGSWVTSIACQALLQQVGKHEAVERGLHWLLRAWPAEGTLWWRLRQKMFGSGVARQNSSLRGWSWTPGTASWVEPTAHALLFLRALPPELLTPQAAKRRQLAERMVYDRMCPGGGWNSGNPLVYGVAGLPRIGPTAWALLALRNDSDRSEIKSSLKWLKGAYSATRGPASMALAHRCLAAYGQPVASLGPALGELHSHNRFFESVVTSAWVLLAWNEEPSGTAQLAGENPTP